MKYKLRYSPNQLYQNCLFAMCVHISAIQRRPMTAYERSWDEMNYSFQSSCYTIVGTISFDMQRGIFVGALRKNGSARFNEYPKKDALEFFEDSDKSIRQLAESQALQYLLLSFEEKIKKNLFSSKVKEIIVPVVTTVFWSEGDNIYSSDDENSFIENGGEYINDICVSKSELIEFLNDYYELTYNELEFAENLFKMKIEGKSRLKRDLFLNIFDESSDGYGDFLSALSDFHFEVI